MTQPVFERRSVICRHFDEFFDSQSGELGDAPCAGRLAKTGDTFEFILRQPEIHQPLPRFDNGHVREREQAGGTTGMDPVIGLREAGYRPFSAISGFQADSYDLELLTNHQVLIYKCQRNSRHLSVIST